MTLSLEQNNQVNTQETRDSRNPSIAFFTGLAGCRWPRRVRLSLNILI